MRKITTATLKSIADRSKVSVSTVSRVLAGKAGTYRISEETASAVTAIAKELGYMPNLLASGLRLRRTRTIGLVIPDISNPFFSSVVRTIERTARSHAYSIILCDSEEDTDLETRALILLQARKVDGLLVFPVGQDASHIREVRSRNIPMVLIDRLLPAVRCPSIASDNFRGAFEAVSYLHAHGHRSIACIQGLKNTSSNQERVRGYRAALVEHGITIDETLIVGSNFGEENGYVETKLILNRERRPTAIFALGNLIALGILRALADEHLRVPEDLSLIAFDDQPYFSFLSTPVTTVAQQNAEIGQIAVKLLLDEMESGRIREPSTLLLPTTLVVRKSVARIDPVTRILVRSAER
jgi:LacI family transcriptional regulator